MTPAVSPICLAQLGESTPFGLLVLAGVVLVTMAVMGSYIKRRKAGLPRVQSSSDQLERLKQERGVRGDLEELMVEIEQLAKRLGAQLDAKTMHIERLLREADERIDELRRLRDGDEPPQRRGAPRRESWSGGFEQPAEPRLDETVSDDPVARSVYQLADAGVAPMEIARRLNEHVGKVELILALRKA
jgi:hypothetical protein